MRIWNISAVALMACALGCNKSEPGGTPGTDATFKITLPGPASQDIKQGDTRTFDGSVDRGSGFKKDVALSVSGHPDKVTVKLMKDSIKASETDTKFTLTVTPDKDAAIGEHEIKITGKPDGGGTPTTGTFKIKVEGSK